MRMPFPTEIHLNPLRPLAFFARSFFEAAFEASQAGQLFLAPRQRPIFPGKRLQKTMENHHFEWENHGKTMGKW